MSDIKGMGGSRREMILTLGVVCLGLFIWVFWWNVPTALDELLPGQ